MKNRKLFPSNSPIISKLFDKIPKETRDSILSEKKKMMNQTGAYIRVQAHVPTPVYAVLKYWGAFDAVGESGFFGALAVDHVHRKIVKEYGMDPDTLSPTHLEA